MGISKLPDTTIKELEAVQRNFWWRKHDSKGFFFTSWPAVSKDKHEGGMGFRDLRSFNSALLAKAAWRLLQNEDKLWAKALKERYFPYTSGFHAKKKKDSTWAWQSIQGSMKFVKDYSFWLIGDGKNISTWADNWIIGKQSPPVPVVEMDVTKDFTKVADLIDQDTKSWKLHIVQQIFSQEDVEKILQTRIPLMGRDKLIWTLTTNGDFTVKSAYRKIIALKAGEAVANEENVVFWKKLWNIPTLPRVKHFLWKCVVDIVPSNERMAKFVNHRGEQCAVCKNGIETTKYILWECSFARAVWSTVPGARRTMINDATTMQDWIKSWFSNVFNNLVDDSVVNMANMSWEIWKSKCRTVIDNIKHNHVEVVRIIQALNDSTGKNMLQKVQHNTTVVQNQPNRWIPPNSLFYSFCCDASFKVINSVTYVGWGLICRNFTVQLIEAGCDYDHGVLSAEAAEYRGLLHIMNHAEEIDIQFAFFEIDAQLVIKVVVGEIQSVAWENQSMILDMKYMLGAHPNWFCKCISRKMNRPANKVAKHARMYSVSSIWFTYPPSFIMLRRNNIVIILQYCGSKQY